MGFHRYCLVLYFQSNIINLFLHSLHEQGTKFNLKAK